MSIKKSPWPLITGILLHLFPLVYFLVNNSSLAEKYGPLYSHAFITGFILASRFVYPLLMCLFAMLLIRQWPKFGLGHAFLGLGISLIYPIYLWISNQWMYWTAKHDAATYGMVLPAVWVAIIIVLLADRRKEKA